MTDVIHENFAAESLEYYVSAPPGAKVTDKVWAIVQRTHGSRSEMIVARRLTKAQATTEAKRLVKLEAQDHVHAMPAGTTGPAIEVRDGRKPAKGYDGYLVERRGDGYHVVGYRKGRVEGKSLRGPYRTPVQAHREIERLHDTQLPDSPKENPVDCACSPQSPAPRSAAYEACLAEGAKLGPMRNPRKVYELVAPAMAKEEQETFVVVPLDARYQLRGAPVEVHRGAASSVQVSTQQVLRAVAMSGAASYVVCHNHPSGKCSPSRADQALTKHLEKSTKAVYGQEVLMVDHLIIGRGQYYSFRENKLHKA
jgi:DNA repair protein RadC